MTWAILSFYGLFAFVALLNVILMVRPKGGGSAPLAALVPARNEEENLKELLPLLVGQMDKVYVMDDASEDRTFAAAREGGATALRGEGPDPGMGGKSSACRRLALAAGEDFPGEWLLFLDADVRPTPELGPALRRWAETRGRTIPVLTGFPRFLPGKGLEPAYLSWVTWILLCTNPFGLVSRTGKGHNLFTNGQIGLWKSSTYLEVDPHRKAGLAVLEDVVIGRLLGKGKIRVDCADLSRLCSVRMYNNLHEAWRGMLKNSVEIAGPGAGSILLSLLLLLCGWAWTLAGPLWWAALGLLVFSRLASNLIVRHPWWSTIFIPLSLTAGSAAILASWWARRTKKVTWKGRTLA